MSFCCVTMALVLWSCGTAFRLGTVRAILITNYEALLQIYFRILVMMEEIEAPLQASVNPEKPFCPNALQL